MNFNNIEYEEIPMLEYDKLKTDEGIHFSDHYTGKIHYFKKIEKEKKENTPPDPHERKKIKLSKKTKETLKQARNSEFTEEEINMVEKLNKK